MDTPDIFLRSRMILGDAAMETLANAHVAVLGLGGVGSFAVEALARAGVGRLTLADHDTVSPTNINRQLGALHSTVGLYKCDVLKDRVLDINPSAQVTALPLRYGKDTRARFFSGRFDYVIDAIDTVTNKLDLIETAMAREIPIVSALGTGNKLDPAQLRITDIRDSEMCPLARIVRKELRRRGITRHTVLWSPEEPRAPAPLEAPPEGRRSVPGSVSWVPASAGLMLGGFVVRALCGL